MPNGNVPLQQAIYGVPPRPAPDMAYGRPMGGPQAPAMTLAAMIQNSIDAKKGLMAAPGNNMMGPPPDGNGKRIAFMFLRRVKFQRQMQVPAHYSSHKEPLKAHPHRKALPFLDPAWAVPQCRFPPEPLSFKDRVD